MAANSAIAVTNVLATGATLTLTGADFTAYQIHQLKQVVDKLASTCTASEGQSATSSTITLPTGF